MSYVAKVLEPGEEIRYKAKLSWTAYVPGALVLILALIVFLIGMHFGDLHPWLYDGGRILAIIIGVIGLLMLAEAFYRRWTTEIAVTNKRVILKRGLVVRRTIEM